MRNGIQRPSRARGRSVCVVPPAQIRPHRRTQQPFNTGSSLLRRPVGLHEDASAYPRLLSFLQPAQRARSGAGQEPSAVRAPGGAEAISARDRRVRRLPASEARGPRETDETDPSAVPLPRVSQGPPAARDPGEEVRARGGAQVIPKPTSQFLRVKCEDCGNEQIVFDRAASVVLCPVCGATVAKTAAARGYDWPDEGDLVVCTVANVKNFGAFVTLDEYESKEGFIHIAEVSSGWIKYIRDYVREGQKVVCKVLKVDKEKGHIDLSLKAVNEHQRREKIQEWKNEQKAENLFAIVAGRLGKTVDECWQEFGYDLLDSFGTLYRAFEESVMDETALEDEDFKGPWVKTFVEVARENIIPPNVTIDGYVEAMDFCPDGAVHIKEALAKATMESDGVSVKVQYIGAPKYRLVVRAPDYKNAEEEIQKAAARVIKALTAKGGEGKFHRKD